MVCTKTPEFLVAKDRLIQVKLDCVRFVASRGILNVLLDVLDRISLSLSVCRKFAVLTITERRIRSLLASTEVLRFRRCRSVGQRLKRCPRMAPVTKRLSNRSHKQRLMNNNLKRLVVA